VLPLLLRSMIPAAVLPSLPETAQAELSLLFVLIRVVGRPDPALPVAADDNVKHQPPVCFELLAAASIGLLVHEKVRIRTVLRPVEVPGPVTVDAGHVHGVSGIQPPPDCVRMPNHQCPVQL